ncbi:MAG: glycosyltransferase family 4 protein [Oribacterium sp.]|nr:glycosyltransferase family 4 protein [Oribacterium sp.]
MRVLMVELFLPESIYSLELLQELKKYAELTVYLRHGAIPSRDKEMVDGIRWIDGFYRGGKGRLAGLGAYLLGLARLDYEIRIGNYDILHIQGFKNAGVEIPFYIWEKARVKKLVYTVHNLLPHEAPEKSRRLYGRFYAACDLLITHNEYTAKLLRENYRIPGSKIYVIPHGAYATLSNHKKEKRRSDGICRFLQFGIFRQYKGIDILLKAIALIPKDQRQHFHFTIAGAWFPALDSTDYKKMAEQLEITDAVTIIAKHIGDDQIEKLYNDADYCLFPYRSIYGSGALLMAYTFGKPVIASNIPAFVEETNCGETGLLFQNGSPEALKEAIIKIADCDIGQRQRYKDNICKLVSDKYNWKKSALQTVKAYEDALNNITE